MKISPITKYSDTNYNKTFMLALDFNLVPIKKYQY